MSLIKCPECGKDVSNLSERCIHCGYPLQGQLKYKSYRAIKKEKEKKIEKEKKKLNSTISCPYCGSSDVRKTTFWSDFGLWQSVGKQWKCQSCDSYF